MVCVKIVLSKIDGLTAWVSLLQPRVMVCVKIVLSKIEDLTPWASLLE